MLVAKTFGAVVWAVFSQFSAPQNAPELTIELPTVYIVGSVHKASKAPETGVWTCDPPRDLVQGFGTVRECSYR